MVELLAIVEAEQAADALLNEAEERRQQAIKEAMADREFRLANLKPPVMAPLAVKAAKPDLASIRQQAKRNKRKAVAAILEELHAA